LCRGSLLAFGLGVIPFSVFGSATALAQPNPCPPFGADTECGVVVTVPASGPDQIRRTRQGPYDGADDILVGVVNESSQPLPEMSMQSPEAIFGFDGDGIDTFGAPGNASDPTGYGGPNATFANISSDMTTGDVDFITPIPPGGTAYFSLELPLTGSSSCQSALTNILHGPVLQNLRTQIAAYVEPENGLTLKEAASLCGFAKFNWQQAVTNLPASNGLTKFGTDAPELIAPPAFWDPPPDGYRYNHIDEPFDSFPYYYDQAELESPKVMPTPYRLNFADTPQSPCLPGGSGNGCPGMIPPGPNAVLGFSTQLVGVNDAGVPTPIGPRINWESTYTGKNGEVTILKTRPRRLFSELGPEEGELGEGEEPEEVPEAPEEPESENGGITVTGVWRAVTYQYIGLSVTSPESSPTSSGSSGGSSVVTSTGPSSGTPSATAASVLTLTGLRVAPNTFRVSPASTAINAAKKPSARGTHISFEVSARASVSFAIVAATNGRRVAGRCRKQTAANAKHKPCRLELSMGTLTRANLPAGANTIPFSGRVGHTALKPGSYQLIVQASGAGGVMSNRAVTSFRVTRP
jgi:hypothetical protein